MKKSGIAVMDRKRAFVDGGENESESKSAERDAQFEHDWNSGMAGLDGVSATTGNAPDAPSSQNDYDRQQAAAMGMSVNAYRDIAYGPGEAPALDAGTGISSGVTQNGSWGVDDNGRFWGNIQDAAAATGRKASDFNNMNNPDGIAALAKLSPTLAGLLKGVNKAQDMGLPGYVGETALDARRAAGMGVGGEGTVSDPFGQTSTAATTTTPPDSKAPLYVWDGTKYVKNDGTAEQSRSDTQGMFAGAQNAAKPQVPDTPILPAGFAAGGKVGIAAGAPTQARYIDGPGDGQSDSVPVKMDDGGQGYLADGEFVIDATTVAGLGNGSSKAGAKILYDMVSRIRTQAHGQNKLQNPVNPDDVLPA